MKKISFLFIGAFLMVLASCVKPGEKAAGNYTGNYYFISNHTGTANATTSTDETVNMDLDCSGLSINTTANGIVVALDGENVTFTYNSTTTTAGEVISLSGTLIGNNLTFSWVISLGGSNQVAGTFTGSK